jgi:serine/threonine protein kinase
MSASSRNDMVLSLDGKASLSHFQSTPEQKESEDDFFLPFEVDIDDLNENGILYSAAVIQAIEEEYAELPDNKYSKTDLRIRLAKYGFSNEILKYAIIINNHKIYLVYKGETWSLQANQMNLSTGEPKLYLAGKGGFGKVKDLQEIKTGRWSADKITPALNAVTPTEMKSLTDLGLINFFETYVSKKKGKQFHLVQRYLPHFDLFEALRPGDRFYNNKARFIKILLSMALRVHELHQLGYVHCDIKPENFRFNALTDEVRLVDTGLSMIASEPVVAEKKGTPIYMAPEVKQLSQSGMLRYTEKVDVYSLGATFLALLGPYGQPSEQYPDSPYKDHRFCLNVWNSLIAPMMKPNAGRRCNMVMVIDQLRHLEKAYPLDSSHREVDIEDFFASLDKQEFIKSLFEFPGVIDIIDIKSAHTLKQYYEFQRTLYTVGVRVGRYILPREAQTSANEIISNAERKRVIAAIHRELSLPSSSLTVVKIEKLTALKNALANDEIKVYADLLRRFSDCMPADKNAHEDLKNFDTENKTPDTFDEMKALSPSEAGKLISRESVNANNDLKIQNKKSFFSTMCCCFFSNKSNNSSSLAPPLITNMQSTITTSVRPK